MRRCIGLVVLVLMVVSVMGCIKSPEEKKRAYLESAQQYMDKGKYADAAIQYQNVLQITPDDVNTLISLGEVQLKLNRPQQAYAAFSKASQADPKNIKAREYLASMLLLAKKYVLAEEQASMILKNDPKNILAKETLAQALFMNGKKEQGIKVMEELLKTQNPTEDLYINAIQMYLATGRMGDALALVSKGASLFPKSPRIRFLASDIFMYKNDINSAKKWAEEAYHVAGDNVNAGTALALFYSRHNMDDLYRSQLAKLKERFPKSPEPLILESTILHQKNDLEGALKAAQKALELKDVTQIRTLIAQILIDKKDSVQAKKMLTETLEKDPNAKAPKILLAQLYLNEKNSTKAIELLSEPLKIAPRSPDVASTAAQAYLIKGDVTKARQILEGALEENPQDIRLHSMIAKIYFTQGEYKKALSETDLLVKNSIKAPDILYIGALSALRSEKIQNASSYIQSLKASVPNEWITLHAEILYHLAQKDMKGAYQIADRAVSLYPNNDDALGLYGYTAPKAVGWQAAITKVDQTCSQVNSAACHMILSALLESSGKTSEALFEIKKAVEREPNKVMLYHALAQFYARHNMIKDALNEYEKILKKNPDDLKAATMLALLNQSSGNNDAAKKVYKYILEKYPKDGLAANNLAWILAEGGNKRDLDEALKLAQTAKDAYPDDPRVADTLGYIYLKKGLPENALGQFQMANEKLQDEPTILYHLALAMVDLKKGTDAVSYLNKSLGSTQQFNERKQAQELLTKLQSGKKK
jgi:tetratricopeptide (TPR) repeat protein